MTPSVEAQVRSFRVAELKDCLVRIGLPRTGKKADQQQRILDYLRDLRALRGTEQQQETAERIIMELYTQLHGLSSYSAPFSHNARADSAGFARPAVEQILPAPSLMPSSLKARESLGQAGTHADTRSGHQNGKLHPTVNGRLAMNPAHRNTQIRCLCDVNIDRNHMIQCEGCGVWQHCACVGVDHSKQPPHFFCETCTVQRADPFWRTLANHTLMPPARMLPSLHPHTLNGAHPETSSLQSLERIFMLPQGQCEPLRRSTDHQLQVACVLLNDSVPFRVHWPKNADLRVNNVRFNTGRRNIMHALGPNGRDEPVSIGSAATAGRNRLTLQAIDGRSFCLLLMLVVRRSQAEVEALMAPRETAEAAQARVNCQVAATNDDIQVATNIVSLRCPLTGSRVKRAGRFQGIDALGGFDLDAFLSMAARTRKWQCPVSMRHASVHQLQNDAFLQGILDRLQSMPDVMEVEVSPEGKWRPANTPYPWQDLQGPVLQPLAQVKPEPGETNWQGKVLPNGALIDSDSESDMSEGEELRQAAQAVAASRKRAKPAVIVISDDSDDDRPPTSRPRPALHQPIASALPRHMPSGHAAGRSSGSNESLPSTAPNGRLHMRNTASTSTSGTHAPSGPSSYSRMPMHGTWHPPVGTSALHSARPAATRRPHALPSFNPASGAASAAAPQPPAEAGNPLRIRIRPPTATTSTAGAHAGLSHGPATSSSWLNAYRPTPPTSSGQHRADTSATQSTWGHRPQMAPVPAEPVVQRSPFEQQAVPSTSSQPQQHRDPWLSRPAWMDGAAAPRRSSLPWGEPPPPPTEPPPLPADFLRDTPDSSDWIGMLLGQDDGGPIGNQADTALSNFGNLHQQSSGQGMSRNSAGQHQVIELSP